MIAAMLAVLDPGDEVIVFEPFYENYGPDAISPAPCRATSRCTSPDWTIRPRRAAAAFNNRTRAIIVNTPHNPTGKVFSRAELELIAELCREHDVARDHRRDLRAHRLRRRRTCRSRRCPGMAERTVAINSLSKTYS
jgi:aspartate/methionine/tyrosine aminotransferase